MTRDPRVRSVIKTGNSLYVGLPSLFVKKIGIKAGDLAEMKFDIKNNQVVYSFKDPRQQTLV